MPKKTPKPFDPAEYIRTDEDAAYALQAAFLEDPGDGSVICETLGYIARSRGMSALASTTGLGRTNLYKSLSENGNPSVRTFFKVCAALNIHFNPTIGKSDS